MHGIERCARQSPRFIAEHVAIEFAEFLGTNPEFEAQTEVRGILEMLGIGDDDEPLDVDD